MNRMKRLFMVTLVCAAPATTACGGMPSGESDPLESVASAEQPLTHGWSKSFGDDGWELAHDVVVDGSDNIITIGYIGWNNTVDFDGAGGAPALSTTNGAIYLAKFDEDGDHVWSKKFEDVYFGTLAADSGGNVYLAGYTRAASVDLGGGSIYVGDGQGVAVVKLDSSGAHVWSKVFSGPDSWDSANGRGIAVDSAGDVLVTGATTGYIEFGTDTNSTGSVDGYVTKLDGSDGSPIFTNFFVTGGINVPGSIAVDPDDDSFAITGRFGGYANFGGDLLESNSAWASSSWETGYDAFVAKFESDGDHLWSKGFGDDYTSEGTDIAIDGSGNIDVIGWFDGDVDFGSNTATLTHPGDDAGDMFLVQFSAAGTDLWSKQFGDTGFDNQERGTGVAVDSAGNVSIIGYFRNSINFGGSTLTSAGATDIAVAQFDDGGTHIWSASYGATTNQLGQGIAVDSSGKVTITGDFYNSVNFGGTTLSDTPSVWLGSGDIFLAQLVP
ncbi:SBBP repeat-containing protein [Sorangium sp. So ce861]|uniref:SBBP repeat-containing protein n=1 Tax=Sorangium sp. So ce861 TaxID=3133323 RepID=UPI003F5E4C9E